MSNVCYTTYKIEGPAEEITAVCDYLKKMQALTEKDNQDYPIHAPNYNAASSERRFYHRMAKYGEGYLTGYQLVSQLTPDSITDLNDGWQVLSIELSSSWAPGPSVVESMLGRVAPNCHFYYYGEEFGCHIAETNDLHRKYFHADYAIEAYFPNPEKTPKKLLKTFTQEATLRNREDQYNRYFSYWNKRELRATLLRLVPNWHYLGMIGLIDAFDLYCDRLYTHSRAHIHIIKIKRIQPSNDRPCTHCEQLASLKNANYELRKYNDKLADLLAHYFKHRHSEFMPYVAAPYELEYKYGIDCHDYCNDQLPEGRNESDYMDDLVDADDYDGFDSFDDDTDLTFYDPSNN